MHAFPCRAAARRSYETIITTSTTKRTAWTQELSEVWLWRGPSGEARPRVSITSTRRPSTVCESYTKTNLEVVIAAELGAMQLAGARCVGPIPIINYHCLTAHAAHASYILAGKTRAC